MTEIEIRLFTKQISKNHVRHSWYVSLLYWLAGTLHHRADGIVSRKFYESN